MLKSIGYLEHSGGALRLRVSTDLILYYKSIIDKEFKCFFNTPAHGGHVSVVLPKTHKVDHQKIKKVYKEYYKKPITFYYDPDIKIGGGKNKGFINFWMNVQSDDLDVIAKKLNIQQPWHLTVCNSKNGVRPYIWMKK